MKLLYGVGYNYGREYDTIFGEGRAVSYQVWRDMLKRCYKEDIHLTSRNKSYIGCTVAEEWHDYQVFAKWYCSHDCYGAGYQIDKDLLFEGNKIYSPETCTLVPKVINNLIKDSSSTRGKYPQGVSWHKRDNKYRAKIVVDGKSKHLGNFDCPDKAFKTYKKAKEAHVRKVALEWVGEIESKVFDALMAWTLT